MVNNRTGSATGRGQVPVSNDGTLSGSGVIDDAVAIASGAGNGKLSAGGQSIAEQFNDQQHAHLQSYSDERVCLQQQHREGESDRLRAVTIASDVLFTFVDQGNGALPPGTVFVVLDNTSTLPIGGRFENIPDGGIVTTNGKNFLANYEGGDGNDLTLTVVPERRTDGALLRAARYTSASSRLSKSFLLVMPVI